jgi:hypothetical protein
MLTSLRRRLLIAPIIAILLTLAVAGTVGASPKTIRPLAVCSIALTRTTGFASVSDGDHSLSIETRVQELKSSDGTTCGEYRSQLLYKSNTGVNESVHLRDAGLVNWPAFVDVSGSWLTSTTTVTATTSFSTFTGPWASIGCGAQFFGESDANESGGDGDSAGSDTAVLTASC